MIKEKENTTEMQVVENVEKSPTVVNNENDILKQEHHNKRLHTLSIFGILFACLIQSFFNFMF